MQRNAILIVGSDPNTIHSFIGYQCNLIGSDPNTYHSFIVNQCYIIVSDPNTIHSFIAFQCYSIGSDPNTNNSFISYQCYSRGIDPNTIHSFISNQCCSIGSDPIVKLIQVWSAAPDVFILFTSIPISIWPKIMVLSTNPIHSHFNFVYSYGLHPSLSTKQGH